MSTEPKHFGLAMAEAMTAVVESADDAILIKSLDGVIHSWNPAAELLLGYRAEEIVGTSVMRLLPEDRQNEEALILGQIAKGERIAHFETVRRRRDGSLVDVSLTVSPIRDRSGVVVGAAKIMRNITERKHAAQQIRTLYVQLEEQVNLRSGQLQSVQRDLAAILDALPSMIGYWDKGLINRIANRGYAKFFDVNPLLLPGTHMRNLLGEELFERTRPHTEAALRGQTVTFEQILPCSAGAGPMHMIVHFVPDIAYGGVKGFYALGHDITEHRLMQQQARDAIAVAEKASRAKSEFLANVSHEIRTPLNAVIGLGYLLEQTTLSDEQQQFLTKIQFAGRALLSVVNNVLDLSKIEAGEMALEHAPFDLPELLREVSQMLAPEATNKGIELIAPPASPLPRMVMGDVLRLRQILTNLMSNSIKFTEAGRVELKILCTEQSSDRIRLRCELSDTGIGIEAAALKRLFSPFTQADTSTTRRFGGTGLGLSIARRFVELMGGEIGVSSTVGVGSTFWFEIPLRIASAAGRGVAARGPRIFIVDPNGDAPQGAGAMVRALGWSPQIVETGEQLLSALRNTEADAWPDLLMLEMQLRDMDAHQLIARLEQQCVHADLPPVIVVVDAAQSYLKQQQLMRPTDILLVRPLTSSALFNAVNAAVSRRPESHERVLQCTNFDERHAQWLAGVGVLVVDDSDINVEVARRILVKQGATVACCSDGESAVEHVRTHHAQLDVVLMDVQMPVLDGNGATRRIREELNLRTLPIIALTAGALVGERQRSLDAGMSDFISKPFDPLALIRTIRRLVEHARGSAIPMVILDDEPGADAAGRPFMASIDAAVVQQMFGDDMTLFESLLTRMLREYADLALPLSVLPEQSFRHQLKGRSHKLKGSAGMIGASAVARFAGAAEAALQNDRPAEVVERILAQLALALTTLREEAQRLLAKPRRPDPGAAPADIVTADLEELSSLLETQNLAAVDKFSALSPSLHQILDAARFERLRSAVDDLDFQLGAELLREAVAG